MPLNIQIGFGDGPSRRLCDLKIVRHEDLVHGKDVYPHSVMFRNDDRNDRVPMVVDFYHAYSSGVLSLTATAIAALLERYPELKSGRFGVPRNRIRCRKCGTVAWSQFRHDFTYCKCGACAVDGGYDYTRRIGNPKLMEAVLEPWQESDLHEGKKSRAVNAATLLQRKRKAAAPTRIPGTKQSTKTVKSILKSPCSSANAVSRNGKSGIAKMTKVRTKAKHHG